MTNKIVSSSSTDSLNDTSTSAIYSTLSTIGKHGLSSFKYYIITWIVFSIINIIFFILAIFQFSNIDSIYWFCLSLVGVGVIGILFTILALYLMYKYILIYSAGVAYELFIPFFQKLCAYIINRLPANNNYTDKVFDISEFINVEFNNKIPKYIRKGILYILNKIPFISLLSDMKDVLKRGDKEEATIVLFDKVDNYINKNILEANKMTPVYWVFVSNVLIQLVLLFIIGH